MVAGFEIRMIPVRTAYEAGQGDSRRLNLPVTAGSGRTCRCGSIRAAFAARFSHTRRNLRPSGRTGRVAGWWSVRLHLILTPVPQRVVG